MSNEQTNAVLEDADPDADEEDDDDEAERRSGRKC